MLARKTIKPGLKFRDDSLGSQPSHYRIHEVIEVNEDAFQATHLPSGNVRPFPLTDEVLENLTSIGSTPLARVDFDCLVGEEVKLELAYGSTLTGIVSAIIYHTIKINGRDHRLVGEIELDRSGSTRFKAAEVVSIDQI